jgi:hypothetical protein
MLAVENTEISSFCQQANRIAARLRGEAYVKPKVARPAEHRIAPKPPITRLKYDWPITEVQQRVLDFMRRFLVKNHQIPPYWVIAKEFGWTSPTSAQSAVNSLAKKGFLERNEIGNWRLARVNVTEVVA